MSIPVEGETRESLVIIDQSSTKEYRIVVEGPTIPIAAFEHILTTIKTQKPRWIIASGSLPKGLPPDVYAKMAKISKEIGSRFILDTSGEALKAALAEGVYLLKPNLRELSIMAGVDSLNRQEAIEAARQLILKGQAEVIVVSLSSEGAVLVTGDLDLYFPSPKVEQRSTVVAGCVSAASRYT